MFGMSLLPSSLEPVEGEISLVRSHSVMAVRSYVKPSSVLTGSVMISAVIGHVYSLIKYLRRHRCASRPTAAAQGALSLQAGAGGLGGGSAGEGGDAARPARKHARAACSA